MLAMGGGESGEVPLNDFAGTVRRLLCRIGFFSLPRRVPAPCGSRRPGRIPLAFLAKIQHKEDDLDFATISVISRNKSGRPRICVAYRIAALKGETSRAGRFRDPLKERHQGCFVFQIRVRDVEKERRGAITEQLLEMALQIRAHRILA